MSDLLTLAVFAIAALRFALLATIVNLTSRAAPDTCNP